MGVPTSTERRFPAPRRLPESAPVYALQALPILGDEHLFFSAQNLNLTTAAQVTLIGRLWSDDDRTVKPLSYTLTIAANSSGTNRVALERGALLTLRVQCDTGLGPNQVYIRLSLIKGFTGGIQAIGTLLQGYFGFDTNLAWPGSPLESPLSGPGAIRNSAWTQLTPTALGLTVPSQRRWRVTTGTFTVVTDATVGARVVRLVTLVAGVDVYRSEASPSHPASTTRNYALTPGLNASAVVPFIQQGIPWLPDVELGPGDSITVDPAPGSVSGAGDAYTGAGVLVREWYQPA
jgi:hypothetical protein